jgi:hypothetical protein
MAPGLGGRHRGLQGGRHRLGADGAELQEGGAKMAHKPAANRGSGSPATELACEQQRRRRPKWLILGDLWGRRGSAWREPVPRCCRPPRTASSGGGEGDGQQCRRLEVTRRRLGSSTGILFQSSILWQTVYHRTNKWNQCMCGCIWWWCYRSVQVVPYSKAG